MPAAVVVGLLLATLAGGVAGCGKSSPTSPTPPTPPTPPTTPTPPTNPPPQAPPVLSQGKFVAFGDSLTEGVSSLAPAGFATLLASQPYPQRLQQLLTDRYTTQSITVANRGVAGEQAVDGLSRLIDVLRRDEPQVVLLLEGYNDLSSYGSKGVNRAIGALESMVKESRARGVKVFIGTLPPERATGPKALPSNLFEKFNSELVKMAADEGAVVVDLSHTMTVGGIGEDGVHPTDAGYEQLASSFLTTIRSALETAPPPTTTSASPGTSTSSR